jgi:hypothetical protein
MGCLRRICFVVVAIALALAAPAHAYGLRCGKRLVGDLALEGEVLSKCGPPATSNSRQVLQVINIAPDVQQVVEIQIDEWLYDFGPDWLTQLVTFENGRLVDVHSGNYGEKKE